MITIDIPKDQAILLRLPLMGDKIRANVYAAVSKLAVELQAYVVQDKLSGQVLNKVTGHLQQSIQQEVTEQRDEVQGKVYSAGDVKYAGIHEFGGTIPAHDVYAKDAKCLAFVWQGKQAFFTHVHIPDVHMPERSFLRSSLEENRANIIDTITRAAVMGVVE